MAATSDNKTREGLEFLDWLYWKPAAARAAGVEVLPLLGSPRDDPPPHIVEAGIAAMPRNVELNETGLPEFRNAAASLMGGKGVRVDPEREIVATNGGYNATFVCLAALIRAGDEVIMPTPGFYYWNSIEILSGKPVFVPTSERDGWAWDLAAIEAAVTPRTKAILFTNPTNPTGYMPDGEMLKALGEIAERHDLILIEDLAYERFTHADKPVTSVGSIPELWPRTLISYTFHKNYSLQAWRAGFIAGAASLVERVIPASVWINLRINVVTQAVATAAMTGPDEWVEEIVVGPYRDGCRRLREGLAGDPGITVTVPTQGGTMGLLNVDGTGLTSTDAAERLLFDYGISTVPLAEFGPLRDSGENVRIAFALSKTHPGGYADVVDRLRSASAAFRAV